MGFEQPVDFELFDINTQVSSTKVDVIDFVRGASRIQGGDCATIEVFLHK